MAALFYHPPSPHDDHPPQATWVEGAVEALMPSSVSSGSGSGGGGGAGKSAAQGSFRKIGGVWRRVGGWGGKGGKGSGSSAAEGEGGAKEDKGQKEEPSSEAEMDVPLPQVDHARWAVLLRLWGRLSWKRVVRGAAFRIPVWALLSQSRTKWISSSLVLRVEFVKGQPFLP